MKRRSNFLSYLVGATASLVFASLLLSGCSSPDPGQSESSANKSSCPASFESADASPEWSLEGTTGKIRVLGSSENRMPYLTIAEPFSIAQTQNHVVYEGNGAVVSANSEVTVCYIGVNGRDNSTFSSTYQDHKPVKFNLNQLVPGFRNAIVGEKVGSIIVTAVTSQDAYPDGQESAGINPGDTLVFAIKILDTAK